MENGKSFYSSRTSTPSVPPHGRITALLDEEPDGGNNCTLCMENKVGARTRIIALNTEDILIHMIIDQAKISWYFYRAARLVFLLCCAIGFTNVRSTAISALR